MTWLRYTLLEIAAAALVLVPIFLLLNLYVFRDWKRSALYCLFALYLVAVYHLVGMPNVTYLRFELNLNLIPLFGMAEDWKNSLLNVVLFVPLGFLLPVMWDQYRQMRKTVLYGFSMSMVVEFLQIFTYRATDVNDLVTNTLGTFLGWRAADALCRRVPLLRACGKDAYITDLSILCIIVLIVMFFVQPFVHSILWDVLLG